jgi:hypothetical protein
MSQEITQAKAVELWGTEDSPLWQVTLPEHPVVQLRAPDEATAIRRYDELCGITSTVYAHGAVRVVPADETPKEAAIHHAEEAVTHAEETAATAAQAMTEARQAMTEVDEAVEDEEEVEEETPHGKVKRKVKKKRGK